MAWVALLFVILFGPVVLLLVRRGRGEKLSQGPDELAEAYRQPPADFTAHGPR